MYNSGMVRVGKTGNIEFNDDFYVRNSHIYKLSYVIYVNNLNYSHFFFFFFLLCAIFNL